MDAVGEYSPARRPRCQHLHDVADTGCDRSLVDLAGGTMQAFGKGEFLERFLARGVIDHKPCRFCFRAFAAGLRDFVGLYSANDRV
jgi:hypothetical protein